MTIEQWRVWWDRPRIASERAALDAFCARLRRVMARWPVEHLDKVKAAKRERLADLRTW